MKPEEEEGEEEKGLEVSSSICFFDINLTDLFHSIAYQ